MLSRASKQLATWYDDQTGDPVHREGDVAKRPEGLRSERGIARSLTAVRPKCGPSDLLAPHDQSAAYLFDSASPLAYIVSGRGRIPADTTRNRMVCPAMSVTGHGDPYW